MFQYLLNKIRYNSRISYLSFLSAWATLSTLAISCIALSWALSCWSLNTWSSATSERAWIAAWCTTSTQIWCIACCYITCTCSTLSRSISSWVSRGRSSTSWKLSSSSCLVLTISSTLSYNLWSGRLSIIGTTYWKAISSLISIWRCHIGISCSILPSTGSLSLRSSGIWARAWTVTSIWTIIRESTWVQSILAKTCPAWRSVTISCHSRIPYF